MTLRPFSADLQKAYRDSLGTPGSPSVIDDDAPVMPVAVVTQSTNLPKPSSTQTPKSGNTGKLTAQASGTAETLLTVTTGKVFYCTQIQFNGAATGAAGTDYQVDILDGTTVIYTIYQGLPIANGPALANSFSFPLPLKFSTSVVMKWTNINTTGTWTLAASCQGWEE